VLYIVGCFLKKRKIQLIDDEPDVVLYLASFLEDHGYEVCAAHDAQTGWEMLEEEEPDLVLLDVMMPGRSGLNFLISLRKEPRFANLPVVFVTGSEKVKEQNFGSYLAQYGARPHDAVVEKPIDPADLLAVIQTFFENNGSCSAQGGS
jgi:twitching motility two-component system response regulator PilH